MRCLNWHIGIALLFLIHSFHLCHSSERGSNDSDDDKNNEAKSGDNDADGWQDDYYNAQHNRQDDNLHEKKDTNRYFDDPYVPTDDSVLAELNANYRRYKEEQQSMKEERKEYTIALVSAGSNILFGLILAMFCASVSLYYAKKTALELKYENEGIVVEARILASEPNIIRNEDEEKPSSGKSKIITKISSDGNSNRAIHDSYSIMSDDDDDVSYQIVNASYSSIKSSSSSSESHDIDSKPDFVHNVSTPRHSNKNPSASEKKETNDFESVWKEPIDERDLLFPTQRYVVVVEYKDIESKFASRIRKRLLVLGSDIKIIKSNSSKEINNAVLVMLYVLKGSPKSGQCCGSIHRALDWKKQIAFFFMLSFCFVLTIVTVLTASKMLSLSWFAAYVVVLLCLVSLQVMCLDKAMSNIISKQYLENGRDLPMGSTKVKLSSFDRNEMELTLKHGVSFV